ncbi:MAG: hypothetical protein Q6363_001060, partial [Candidatus Njordarchaeota archaeon]
MTKGKTKKKKIPLDVYQAKINLFYLLKRYRGIPFIHFDSIYDIIASFLNIYKAHFFPPSLLVYMKEYTRHFYYSLNYPNGELTRKTLSAFVDMFSTLRLNMEQAINQKLKEQLIKTLYGIQSYRFKNTGNIFELLIYDTTRYCLNKRLIAFNDFLDLFKFIEDNMFENENDIMVAYQMYLKLLYKFFEEKKSPKGDLTYDTINYFAKTTQCNNSTAYYSVVKFLEE